MSDKPRDLGHNHDERVILPVGECVRCDFVRGTVALERSR